MADFPTRGARRAAREATDAAAATAAIEAIDDTEATDDTDAAAAQRQPRSMARALWSAVRELLIVVLLAVALSFLIKTFLIQPFHIPSGSMEDTLVRDDRVIVSKLTPGPFALQRGDIVVFSDPDHWMGEVPPVPRSSVQSLLIFIGLAPDDSHEYLIKRVIGLPGDQVACCDARGQLTVNGVAISEPYVKAGDTPAGSRPGFSIRVPADRVWVMGDHRSDSADSRMHDDGTGATGSVPIGAIKGRAILVVWPLSRVSWLSVPDRVFAPVPGPSSPTQPVGPTTPVPARPTASASVGSQKT